MSFFAKALFPDLFGGASKRATDYDVIYTLTMPLAELVLGGKCKLMLQSGRAIEVTIPPGIKDGKKLRLRGLGQPDGNIQGEAVVEIKIDLIKAVHTAIQELKADNDDLRVLIAAQKYEIEVLKSQISN